MAIAASAQSLTNPGFETGDFTGWSTQAASTGSSFGVDSVSPHSGTFAASFGATNDRSDRIFQSFASTPGLVYTLSYYLRDTDPTAPGHKAFGVIFSGPLAGTSETVQGNVGGDYNQRTLTLLAADSTLTVTFLGYHATGRYYLDDVSLSAQEAPPIPEPGTMAALGLGALGILRRKTRKA